MCLPKRVIFNALVLPEKMVLLQMLLQSFVKMFFCNPSHKPWGNPFLRYCTSAQYHFLIPQKTVLRIPRFPILEAFSLFFLWKHCLWFVSCCSVSKNLTLHTCAEFHSASGFTLMISGSKSELIFLVRETGKSWAKLFCLSASWEDPWP